MNAVVDHLSSAAAWTLRNSLEASLLLVALLLLSWLGGAGLAPRFRAALWILAGARLLLPFAPESAWSVFNLVPDLDAALSARAQPVPAPSAADFAPGPAAIDPGIAVSGQGDLRSHAVAPDFRLILSLVWVTGVLVVLGSSAVRQVRAARRVRRLPAVADLRLRALLSGCAREAGVPLKLTFTQAPCGAGVAVFGMLRATHLIVPADFNERYSGDEIRGILLHELEHVRRHDLLWNWAALLVLAAHWFNPLVWLASRRFTTDREVICDRAALNRLPGERRRTYGAALIKALEIGRHPAAHPALVPFISRKNQLTYRLIMIAKSSRRQSPAHLFVQFAAAVMAAALCMATFTSATADEERERGGERETEAGRGGERETEAGRGGERESEGARGEREGEAGATRREGPRDGEGTPREGAREGEAAGLGATIVRVFEKGVVFGDREVRNEDLAKFLSEMPRRPGAVVLTAQPDVSFGAVVNVMNALQQAGIARIQIRGSAQPGAVEAGAEGPMRPEGARDGDGPPREGARDGEGAKREGARDGEGAKREGPRDGEGPPRTGPGDGEGERKEGPRDGEGERKEGPRDGEGVRPENN